MDDGPEPYASLPPPPEEIAELCAACFRFVTDAVGVAPDFTLETLPLVDHYLSTARTAIAERPEVGPLIVRAVGAYFGEVVRCYVPSFWRLPSPDAHEWRLCGRHVFLSFSPIGAAEDALHGGTAHDGPDSQLRLAPEDRSSVAQRLENLPPVSAEEYHLLATRLEVIQIAVEELRAQMEVGGQNDTVFDPEDYDDDLRPLRPIGQA